MENRTLCKISLAVIATSIAAVFVIPAVYRSRGYMDIGGEWLFLGMIFTVVYKFSIR